ncbi:MAG: hypothetical protein PHN72_05525 [Bacilli bacterium]|nr:hypothetical protein [Bacilli bacterium]
MKKLYIIGFLLYSFFIGNVVLAEEAFPVCSKQEQIGTERRYLWYEKREEASYFYKDKNTEAYPFIDTSKTKYGAWSLWQEEVPSSIENRQIESRNIYAYQEKNAIRYLFLDQFKGTGNKLIIPEIEVYDNGKKIPFKITCEDCSPNFIKDVTDGVVKDDSSYVKESGTIKIDLLETKVMKKLEVHVYLYDTTNAEKSFRFLATHLDNKEDVYYQSIEILFFQNNSIEDITYYPLYGRKTRQMKDEFGNIEYSTTPIEETADRRVSLIPQYRYQDLMYRYYQVFKNYDKEYQTKGIAPFLYKDETKFKDFTFCTSKKQIPLEHTEILIDVKEEPAIIKPNQLISTRLYQKAGSTNEEKQGFKKGTISKKNKNCEIVDSAQYTACKREKSMSLYFLLILCILFFIREIYQKMTHERKL